MVAQTDIEVMNPIDSRELTIAGRRVETFDAPDEQVFALLQSLQTPECRDALSQENPEMMTAVAALAQAAAILTEGLGEDVMKGVLEEVFQLEPKGSYDDGVQSIGRMTVTVLSLATSLPPMRERPIWNL